MAAASEGACGGLDCHPHARSVPLDRGNRRVLVLRAQKNGAPDEAHAGASFGCLVQDRPSRFIAACATGGLADELVDRPLPLPVPPTPAPPLTRSTPRCLGH